MSGATSHAFQYNYPLGCCVRPNNIFDKLSVPRIDGDAMYTDALARMLHNPVTICLA